MLSCIPKNLVDKLKKGVQAGEISIEKLSEATPKKAREIFAKYIGKENAKGANALFQKAMLSNQKQAMRNWVWKNFWDGKPLYTALSLENSTKLKNSLTMKGLKGMGEAQRLEALAKVVDRRTAEILNKRFEALKKTGNLANWEERVFGTNKMREDAKLKGALKQIEDLDDIGLLNPKQAEDFMEDFVSAKLGVDITVDQSRQLSKLSKKAVEAFDEVGSDWTHLNEKKIRDYFNKRKALEEFTEKLTPAPMGEVFTNVGARGAMLYAARSAVNSFMFQVIPGITRAITKRLTTGAFLPGDFKLIDRASVMMSSFVPSPAELNFLRKQTGMALRIYKDTGYDISRMQNLDDGFRFFGEKFTHVNGPTLKESQGVKEKMGALVRGHARLMQPALKYAAGGTDTIFANIHRNDTTLLVSKIAAKLEARAGKLPKGMTEKQRSLELAKESLSFNPKTEKAQYIREAGIMDGHMANFTNNDSWGEFALRMRNSLKFGKDGEYKVGEVLIPFLKIPANAMGAGFEATGPGLITGTQKLFRALKMEKGASKANAVGESLNRIIAAGGLFGGSVFLTSLLSPEDFVGAYDYTQRSANKLTTTKNAGSSYIRLGGKWYSTRWLGPMTIPVNAMMYSRQSKAKGESALVGYVNGIFWGLTQFPGVKEVGESYAKIQRVAKSNPEKMVETMGLDTESIRKWWQTRLAPSFFTYDVLALKNETKFDALGRPIPKRGDSTKSAITGAFVGANIKTDTSNEITKEFDKLFLTGNLPTLTEPVGVEDAIDKLGEQEYLNKLNEFKKKYAEKVEKEIKSTFYQRLSPEDKKKKINKIRQEEILNKVKAL